MFYRVIQTCFLFIYLAIYQENQFLELQNEFVREVAFVLVLFATFIMAYEFTLNSLKSPVIRDQKR